MNPMHCNSSESLMLTLSYEVERLGNYQCIAMERIIKSINPSLKHRLKDDMEMIHQRLEEIYKTFDALNIEQLTLGTRLLYEQNKRALQRSTSLRLTCS